MDSKFVEPTFKPNGCTFFPEGSWGHCCNEHDYAYWSGVPRMEADIDLYVCIAQTHPAIALIVFVFVVMFGGYFYRRARRKREGYNRVES